MSKSKFNYGNNAGGKRFEFRTTIPEDSKLWTLGAGHHNAVTVSVYYALGGMNYFSNSMIPRGYRISITPSRVENNSVITTPMSGTFKGGCTSQLTTFKVKRYNLNKHETITAIVETNLDALLKLYFNTDNAALIAWINDTRFECNKVLA